MAKKILKKAMGKGIRALGKTAAAVTGVIAGGKGSYNKGKITVTKKLKKKK